MSMLNSGPKDKKGQQEQPEPDSRWDAAIQPEYIEESDKGDGVEKLNDNK